jgi:hypothetical protein
MAFPDWDTPLSKQDVSPRELVLAMNEINALPAAALAGAPNKGPVASSPPFPKFFYYGPTPSGGDDLPAVQAVVNAAKNTNGGRVILQSALHLFSNSLLMDAASSVVLEGAATNPGIHATGNPANTGTVIAPMTGFLAGNYLITADATNAPGNALVGVDIRTLMLNCRVNGAITSTAGLSGGINFVGPWDGAIERVNVVAPYNGSYGIRIVGFGGTTGNSNWVRGCTVSGNGTGAGANGFYLSNWESNITQCCAIGVDIGFSMSGGVQNVLTITGAIADTCRSAGYYHIGGRVTLDACQIFGGCVSGPNIKIENGALTVLGGHYTQESNATGNPNITDSTGHQGNLFVGVHFTGSASGTLTAAVYSGGAATAGNWHIFSACTITNPARYATPWVVSGGPAGFLVRDVSGYSPVGPSNVVPGASPWTCTNADFGENDYYISGGTVTTITKGGFTVDSFAGAAAHSRVRLLPGESFILTYTVAPNVTKDQR